MKITEKEISQFIYEPYLSRGKNYCERGLVNILYISKHRVRALCLGTKIYIVSIKLNNGRLEGKCSCPALDLANIWQQHVLRLLIFTLNHQKT